MDWINKYIGLPWKNGEQDCWWLVRQIYRDQLDIELPQIVIDATNIKQVIKSLRDHPEHDNWIPVDTPQNLRLTFFYRRKQATHVGVYIDYREGRILHIYKGAGCVLQSLNEARLAGWATPKFYRHKSIHE